MDFYPPRELPPIQDAPHKPVPPVTRKRIALFVVVSSLLGLLLAMALFWSLGNIVAFAIVPVAAALGCHFGAHPRALRATHTARHAGPVLW